MLDSNWLKAHQSPSALAGFPQKPQGNHATTDAMAGVGLLLPPQRSKEQDEISNRIIMRTKASCKVLAAALPVCLMLPRHGIRREKTAKEDADLAKDYSGNLGHKWRRLDDGRW